MGLIDDCKACLEGLESTRQSKQISYQLPIIVSFLIRISPVGNEPELRVRNRETNCDSSSLESTKKVEPKLKVVDPIGILKAGLRTVRHRQFGWLAEDLKASGEIADTKESLNTRLWSDYNAQLVHMRAMRDILGDDYDPLHVLAGRDNEGKFTFTKNVDVPKNHLSLAYLLHAYGVSQAINVQTLEAKRW